jgi:hypothetical protein
MVFLYKAVVKPLKVHVQVRMLSDKLFKEPHKLTVLFGSPGHDRTIVTTFGCGSTICAMSVANFS